MAFSRLASDFGLERVPRGKNNSYEDKNPSIYLSQKEYGVFGATYLWLLC